MYHRDANYLKTKIYVKLSKRLKHILEQKNLSSITCSTMFTSLTPLEDVLQASDKIEQSNLFIH